MPTSTSRFRFEFEMDAWARRFIVPLAGDECAFFVALRNDGSVRRLYIAQPGRAFSPEQKARMTSQNPRWFLFVPYFDEGAAFLEWQKVDQESAERWVGRAFERDDFLDVRASGSRERFPETWRVIIA